MDEIIGKTTLHSNEGKRWANCITSLKQFWHGSIPVSLSSSEKKDPFENLNLRFGWDGLQLNTYLNLANFKYNIDYLGVVITLLQFRAPLNKSVIERALNYASSEFDYLYTYRRQAADTEIRGRS